MTPADPSSARIRRLIAEITADRRAMEDRSAEAQSFATRIAPGAPELTAAAALSLDRAYSSFEAILDRIARSLEGGVPVGPDWHLALLDGARLDIDGVRPAILRAAALEVAHEVRRFRHFLRHSYAAQLRDDRVRDLCRQWGAALPTLRADLDGFAAFLIRLIEKLEAPAT